MSEFLTLDEVHPTVDLAAYYDAKATMWHRYRVPGSHFLLIKSGEVEAISPTGHYHAKPGDMLSFRATEVNQYGTHGPVVFYEAHIQLARPPKHTQTLWLDEIGLLPEHLSLGNQFDRMREQFETLCIDLPNADAASRCRVNGAVWQMLNILATVAKKLPDGGQKLDEWQRARLRLSTNLKAPLEIQDLAKEMGISADHFIRRFKQRFGVTPKLLRTQARLRFAAQSLRAGGGSIKSLAFDLGFEDAYSFTRAFKRYLGVLPSDLRPGGAEKESTIGTPAETGSLLKPNQHIVPANVQLDAALYSRFTPPPKS